MENYTDKNCLIMGFGISGKGAYEALKRMDAHIFVYDEDLRKCAGLDVVKIKKLKRKILKDMDAIILSPTARIDKKYQKVISKRNIECLGELEFAYRLCPGTIFAVTGSNGKTTTSMLLKELLETTPKKTYLLGNVGNAFSKYVLDIESGENVVLECSSFQLMQTKEFRPHIACLLNLEPDHLNFHKDVEEYYNAKLKIFANQTENDFAVINYDDEQCLERTKNLRAKTFYFSIKKLCKGTFIQDDAIMFSDGAITYPIVKLADVRYLGEHNLSNYLCATLMAILGGVSLESIGYVLNHFNTPAHRLEFVRRLKNVDYYNDSKATNISACITACKAFDKPLHLLLGGSDKGEDFGRLLKELPKNVKYVYLFGATSKAMYKHLRKSSTLVAYKCETLKTAINFAHLKAKRGEVVLLSPACASFDTFNNFEERGEYFKDRVNELE